MVTGAATGIGRALAVDLLERGVPVLAADRDIPGLEHLVRDVTVEQGAHAAARLRTLVCDVRSDEDTQALAAAAQELHSERQDAERATSGDRATSGNRASSGASVGTLAPQRLVHCAAVMPAGRLVEVPTSDVLAAMDLDYGGTVRVVHPIAAAMVARGSGEIVLFGSVAGDVLSTDLGAYSAAKAAVNAYGEVLARELADTGVTVRVVAPAVVRTGLMARLSPKAPGALRSLVRRGKGHAPEDFTGIVDAALNASAPVRRPGSAQFYHVARRVSPAITLAASTWLSRRERSRERARPRDDEA